MAVSKCVISYRFFFSLSKLTQALLYVCFALSQKKKNVIDCMCVLWIHNEKKLRFRCNATILLKTKPKLLESEKIPYAVYMAWIFLLSFALFFLLLSFHIVCRVINNHLFWSKWTNGNKIEHHTKCVLIKFNYSLILFEILWLYESGRPLP